MTSHFHLLEVESYKLTYSEKEYCDGDISIQELSDAIKSMKSNKSPGSDDLTSELLTALWDDLKDLYIEMINQVFHNERLPESWGEGLISLLEKKIKSPLFIKICIHLPFSILTIRF